MQTHIYAKEIAYSDSCEEHEANTWKYRVYSLAPRQALGLRGLAQDSTNRRYLRLGSLLPTELC